MILKSTLWFLFFTVVFVIDAGFAAINKVSADDSVCKDYPIDTAVYLTNPYNCSQYYECYGGHLFIMNCANNTYWNQKLQYCDYWENADCNNSSVTSTSAPNNATTAAPNAICDGYPLDELTLLPNPYDCHRYYECYEGNLFHMNCPGVLLFNPELKVCDYPSNVDCSHVIPTGSTIPSNNTTPAATTSNPNATKGTPNPVCAGYDPDELILIPDPYDCQKYYECYQGDLFVMNCSGDLVFNPELRVCDYPYNVNCSQVNTTTTTPKPTTAPVTNSTTPTPTTTPTTVPTTTQPNAAATICKDKADGTYVADPYDCKSYYECSNHRGTKQTCGGDLLWNQQILNCDYAYNVDCKN